jgi:hypothetical protein
MISTKKLLYKAVQKIAALASTVSTTSESVTTLSGTVGTLSTTVGNLSNAVSAINDYVTSKGTDGGWAYRKWHSGKVEAWYVGELSFSPTTVAGQSFYADGTLAIPSGIFNSAPSCIGVPSSSSGGTINAAVFSLLTLASSSTSITTRAFRVSANSANNWKANAVVYAWTN